MDVKIEIINELKQVNDGLTICNLMDRTGFSRGAIKMNLLYLMIDGKVREIAYSQNTKVYKLKKG